MSKKTETIEIRVSPELKAELVEKSRAEGKTMSSFLRDRITGGDAAATEDDRPSGGRRAAVRIAVGIVPAMALAGVYAALAPVAATATPSARMAFAELDLNGDGGITVEEYHTVMQPGAGLAMDADLPKVCAADLAAATSLNAAQAEIAEMDANGDGKVRFHEMLGSMQRSATEAFLMADRNADGYLSGAELSDVTLGADDQISPACMDALTAAWGNEAGAFEADQLGHIMVAELDTDRDGRVSLIEFISG